MSYLQEGKRYNRIGGSAIDHWKLVETSDAWDHIYIKRLDGFFMDVVPRYMEPACLLEAMRLNGYEFVTQADGVWTFKAVIKPPIPLTDSQIGETNENVKAVLDLLTECAGLYLADRKG